MTKLWYSDSEMVTINSDTTCIAVWKWATPQDVLVENHARMQAISCRTALFLKKQGTGCGTVSSLCGGSYTAHGKTWRWLQPTLGKPSMKSDRENEEEEEEVGNPTGAAFVDTWLFCFVSNCCWVFFSINLHYLSTDTLSPPLSMA